MTPEEKARVKIDQWLYEAGWQVVDRDEYEPTMTAVAVREGLLKGNKEADYFMFINGKAVGVLEAKREEVDVNSDIVSEQVATYARSVPNCYQTWMKPLPMLYKSNGKVVLFEDYRKSNTDWDELNRIHTPREIVKMLGIDDFFCRTAHLAQEGVTRLPVRSHYRTGEMFSLRTEPCTYGACHRCRQNLYGLLGSLSYALLYQHASCAVPC